MVKNAIVSPASSLPDLQVALMARLAALEKTVDLQRTMLDASSATHLRRIRELEDQLGKVPPLLDRIAAMEKTLAKLPSLNPSIVKAIRENVDWTKIMSDEEDLLEEDYRGWPEEKERVRF